MGLVIPTNRRQDRSNCVSQEDRRLFFQRSPPSFQFHGRGRNTRDSEIRLADLGDRMAGGGDLPGAVGALAHSKHDAGRPSTERHKQPAAAAKWRDTLCSHPTLLVLDQSSGIRASGFGDAEHDEPRKCTGTRFLAARSGPRTEFPDHGTAETTSARRGIQPDQQFPRRCCSAKPGRRRPRCFGGAWIPALRSDHQRSRPTHHSTGDEIRLLRRARRACSDGAAVISDAVQPREPPRIFTLQRWRAGRRCCLRLHHQPVRLRRRVGRLLPRPRLHWPRYINYLLTRRRARQRFQREASPRFVLCNRGAVQPHVEHPHVRRQIADLHRHAPCGIPLPRNRDRNLGGAARLQRDLFRLCGHREILALASARSASAGPRDSRRAPERLPCRSPSGA